MYHAGLTGTRKGATLKQLSDLENHLIQLLIKHGEVTLHVGCCFGADYSGGMLAHSLGIHIIQHPANVKVYRAMLPFGDVLPPDGYYIRNRAIVDASEELIVLPAEETIPVTKIGGTWYTYKYALGKDKPVTVYYA